MLSNKCIISALRVKISPFLSLYICFPQKYFIISLKTLFLLIIYSLKIISKIDFYFDKHLTKDKTN
jgi:hypothetical protein